MNRHECIETEEDWMRYLGYYHVWVECGKSKSALYEYLAKYPNIWAQLDWNALVEIHRNMGWPLPESKTIVITGNKHSREFDGIHSSKRLKIEQFCGKRSIDSNHEYSKRMKIEQCYNSRIADGANHLRLKRSLTDTTDRGVSKKHNSGH